MLQACLGCFGGVLEACNWQGMILLGGKHPTGRYLRGGEVRGRAKPQVWQDPTRRIPTRGYGAWGRAGHHGTRGSCQTSRAVEGMTRGVVRKACAVEVQSELGEVDGARS
jgi:hypothetical protein